MPEVGMMLNQRAHGHRHHQGVDFAIDNGSFAATQRGDVFDADRVGRWLCWMGTLPRERCLFVAAPDVVGDCATTWDWGYLGGWLATIRWLGFPVAYVGQDGLEDHEPPWDHADTWDVLFLGGTDEWKDGPDAELCAREAKAMGKGLHMGRVNTLTRWRWAHRLGCDTVDGTMLRWGDRANLPKLRKMVANDKQGRLW